LLFPLVQVLVVVVLMCKLETFLQRFVGKKRFVVARRPNKV
jgi:hypothetical protein